MKNKIISFFKSKSEFTRNVLTLITGTIISQAIPIAISPILTRIYSPEDFGVFALYMSIVSIISVFSTGRYEMAILLPKKEVDAIHLLVLSCIITLFVGFITFITILIFNSSITNFLGNPEISNWLYLIPVSIIISGLFKSLNYWFNRKKYFKRLAINKIIQSGSNSSFNLGFGAIGLGISGLIISSVIGQALASFVLGKITWKEIRIFHTKNSNNRIRALAKRYNKFPKYDILATLSNVLSRQATHIFFNKLFNSTPAGYYYFTQRIIELPITFLATSISDVFREEASRSYQVYGNARNIYISTLKKLFILSVIPSIILLIFAKDIFSFVFGDNWAISGVYAQILSPMLFLKFIASPLSFMFYIGEKQQLNLIGNVLFLALTVISFYLSNSGLETVRMLSISYSFIYILYLIVSAKIAKVF